MTTSIKDEKKEAFKTQMDTIINLVEGEVEIYKNKLSKLPFADPDKREEYLEQHDIFYKYNIAMIKVTIKYLRFIKDKGFITKDDADFLQDTRLSFELKTEKHLLCKNTIDNQAKVKYELQTITKVKFISLSSDKPNYVIDNIDLQLINQMDADKHLEATANIYKTLNYNQISKATIFKPKFTVSNSAESLINSLRLIMSNKILPKCQVNVAKKELETSEKSQSISCFSKKISSLLMWFKSLDSKQHKPNIQNTFVAAGQPVRHLNCLSRM